MAKKKSAGKSDLDHLLDDIEVSVNEANAKVEKLQDSAYKVSNKFFQKGLKLLFKTHDSLESFAWKQYTPGWNDGDPCEFSAHVDYIFINDEEEESTVYWLEDQLEKLNSPDLNEQIISLQKGLIEEKDSYKKEKIIQDLKILNLNPVEVEKKLKTIKDITNFLSKFDNYFFERSFGEGKVFVTPNSIDTRHCDHD